MKRAVEASQPAGPPAMFPEKAKTPPIPAATQLKDSSKTTTPNKDSQGPHVAKNETSEPVSQKEKTFPPQTQKGKLENAKAPLIQTSQVPETKPSQDRQQTGPKKPPDTASQPGTKQSDSTAATQQQSSGFFGFGGPKSQPDTAKPAVTEKMFGFGSSIFSSASTLITSAVQDQPKTTPPVSPKMSPAKVIKPSPSAQKLEQQKKTDVPLQTKAAPPEQVKVDKAQTGVQKLETTSRESVKLDSSSCPLCKTGLNRGTKDPPNYNSCTECKSIVCKQCGFNPMPNETGVSLERKHSFKLNLYQNLACWQKQSVCNIYNDKCAFIGLNCV